LSNLLTYLFGYWTCIS